VNQNKKTALAVKGENKMDLKKVKALLLVKENKKEDVGKLSNAGDYDDGLLLQITPEVETEIYTKYDFNEPQEENFIDFINEAKNELPEGVTMTFLTELEDD
jgi:hypothetical protein